MSRSVKQRYQVHVFRPNGQRFTVLDVDCTKAQIAIARAKKRIYQMGCLAHFYTYVPTLVGATHAGA